MLVDVFVFSKILKMKGEHEGKSYKVQMLVQGATLSFPLGVIFVQQQKVETVKEPF